MTRWAAFAGVTLAVLTLLLILARASQSLVTDDSDATAGGDSSTGADSAAVADSSTGTESTTGTDAPTGTDAMAESDRSGGGDAPASIDGTAETGTPPDVESSAYADPRTGTGSTPANGPHRFESSGPHGLEDADREPDGSSPAAEMSTLGLLANVAASHGLFAVLLLAGIWLTGVPWSALGVTDDPLSTGPLALAVGLALGVGLALANAFAAGLAKAFDADPSEELRSLLAPETRTGWAVLLLVVLPVIAGFEELLFRAALIGALSVGFEISPWLLAVLSSVAFALGHGAQGTLGIVVTGLLGFALAVAFVLTGSLLVVVVAHYVVNAAEFVVVEGLGWEPFEGSIGGATP